MGLSSVGVEADKERLNQVVAACKGKSTEELIAVGLPKLASMGGGGGAAPAAAAEAAAPKKEEKKEESEEEDDDMGFTDSGTRVGQHLQQKRCLQSYSRSH